ncbi:discoidin domain-containing protein [Actinomadura barringtoniae]|uniref:Discoidin domain-containing protein n=1 Tax=Actinomadura barringtoniae TaxID=1427535 RepID=A0A939T516_9ACTN|nr:discoidin domain-containing protein [Actinomadura barringtoniae]MBO2448974.1 discoidin domain-containing protein [Actinomadura barringtoniae]
MRQTPLRILLVAALAAIGLTGLVASPAGAHAQPRVRAAAATNLAAGKPVSASTSNGQYTAANVNDGNQATYWESANNAFPQWIQVDLGASVDTNKVVLKLPVANWAARTQTLSVQGSTNGTGYSDLVGSAGRVFDPASNNTVTLTYDSKPTRYLRVLITANTGWPAGQLSELEVYGPTTGDQTPPTAPSNLAYTEPASGQIKLTWNASSDAVGVTGYDVYANNALRGSVAGNVLTYTDNQPDSATVSYFVRAKDAAGNVSPDSNVVTRQGRGGGGTNLAAGKPITASSHVFDFVETNANDNNLATYWESGSGAYPATLTVSLGAKADISSVVVKLNPDAAWSTRTQNIEVQGRSSTSGSFTTLKAAADYTFNPSTGNSATIPVSGNAAEVRLKFASNTGAPGAQAAEFQVIGTPAPTPDLTVTDVSWTPSSPIETDDITLKATVKNAGTGAADASGLDFLVGGQKTKSASVGALAAGASQTVSASIGTRDAGSYTVGATADANDDNIELNETNNTTTAANKLTVGPVPSSDLVAQAVTWSPGNPQNGDTVTFSVQLRNDGTLATASGAHAITLSVLNSSDTVVKTLTGSYNGSLAPGASAAPINLGTWTAANGRYTVQTVIADDANEVPVKRANNTSKLSLFVGRGANMPYDTYEAEDGALGGGAAVVGPNRKIGDLAGEASGRRAVTLNSTGASVEFTTRAATNTLVTRYSIPDSSGGGGQNSTLNVYVDGTFLKAIDLTSRYTWVYGAEASPSNSPGSGDPRHIYDEANLMLGTTVPAGHKIKLQKDAANGTTYAIDFINTEQAAAQANPDPAHYAVPAGFTHQDVQNALDKVRQDTSLTGVYLPAGDYDTAQKFQVYGKGVKVVGAGPWFTRFRTPQGQENTDAGFRTEASSNGSTFSGFSFFGNYTSRIDGPGKVFDFNNVKNMTIDNVWIEHTVCMFWGSNVDGSTIKNARIRDTWADGINLTNGSSDNSVSNTETRTTGDDSFALFPATDNTNEQETGNTFENLTSLLTWRAAGMAVYGGGGNTFRNIHIADTLTYPGLTIATLQFGGIPARGFESDPKTTFQNISLVRDGGHFWGQQAFPALWIFSGEFPFQGIRISDVDIVDPTYSGIMFQTKYTGGQALKPIADTVLTNVTISGAHKSGDAFDAKSGFGIWVNELPEPGQGPAVGSATFNGLHFRDNFQDIKNTTSTFTIVQNP